MSSVLGVKKKEKTGVGRFERNYIQEGNWCYAGPSEFFT